MSDCIETGFENIQYHAMIDDMTELVSRQGSDLRFIFVNKAFSDFLGRSADELQEINELDLVHKDDQEKLLQAVDSFSPESPITSLTVRYKNSKGEFSWVEWKSRAFFNEEGQLIEYQAVGRDITEYIKTQEYLQNVRDVLEMRVRQRTKELNELVEKLEATNNYLNSILKNITEGVAVIDRIGNIDFLNSVLEQEWKNSVNEFKDLFRDHIVKAKNNFINEMLLKNKPFYDIEITLTKESKSFPCLMSGTAIYADNKTKNNKGVVIIKPIKKVHNLVNRLSGAYAKYSFDDIITNSKAMLKTKSDAQLAALSDGNVMIEGESGTGKEMFAQSIHNGSNRRNGPFVAINCGAIPRDLISSELFGYVEGAFTGAKKGGQPGKFELASGGTIFLDEIGDMPFEQQISLLRVLQEKNTTRIGAQCSIPVDVRIICATNKNLFEETRKGNFRLDLYYRLNVINISIPPLRNRKEDITILFEYFLAKTDKGKSICVDPDVFERLRSYNWPGNVRELQNTVERLVYFTTDNIISIGYLPENILNHTAKLPATTERVDPITDKQSITVNEVRKAKKKQAEENEIHEMLILFEKYNGNVSEAARKMGMSRSTLYRKMKNYKTSNYEE